MKIYIKELDKDLTKLPKTRYDFIVEYFAGETPKTYTKSKEGVYKLQCDKDCSRSIDDILSILNTYYPRITYKKLMFILLTLHIKKKYYFTPYFCYDIEKCIPHFYYLFENNTEGIISDIFENLFESTGRGNSKYTWIELFEMHGIKNESDLEAFFKKHDNK